MRLAMTYGSSYWALNKKEEIKTKAAKLRTLRCDVHDQVGQNQRNEHIEASLRVTDMCRRENKKKQAKTV